MSLERKERRRCDICKEVISDKDYYSCTKQTAGKDNIYIPITTNGTAQWNSYTYANHPYIIDVCLDCWSKLTLDK